MCVLLSNQKNSKRRKQSKLFSVCHWTANLLYSLPFTGVYIYPFHESFPLGLKFCHKRMSNNGVPNPIHYWLLSIQIFLFSSSALNARTAHGWGTKHQNPIKGGSHNLGHGSSSSSVYDSYQPYSPIFDVPSFGARGDGVSDDSKVSEYQKPN